MASGEHGAAGVAGAGGQVSILVLVKYGLGDAGTRRASWRTNSLNSCSGEVWPRGAVPWTHAERPPPVSILVLVKYGLGVPPLDGGPGGQHEGPVVSILVLVKYGLGVFAGGLPCRSP